MYEEVKFVRKNITKDKVADTSFPHYILSNLSNYLYYYNHQKTSGGWYSLQFLFNKLIP